MMYNILVSVFGALSVSTLCYGEAAADPRPQPQPSPAPHPKPDPKAQPGPDPEPDPYFGIGVSAFLNPGLSSHHYSHGQQQSCHYHGNNLLGVYPHCYSVSRFCRLIVARPHLLARLSGLYSYYRKYCHYNVNHDYGLGQGGLGIGQGGLGLGQGGLGLGQGGLGLGHGGLGSGGLGHHGGGGYGYYDDYDHGGYIYPDYGIGAYGRSGYGY